VVRPSQFRIDEFRNLGIVARLADDHASPGMLDKNHRAILQQRKGMKDLPTKIQGYPYEPDASRVVFF
jgi:hypothetical protein